MKNSSVIIFCWLIALCNSCAPDNSSRCINALKKHLAIYAGDNANNKSASSILSHNSCADKKLVKLLKLYNPGVDYIEVIDPDVLVQFYTIRVHLSRSKEDAYIEAIYEKGDKVMITGIDFKNRESNQWNQCFHIERAESLIWHQILTIASVAQTAHCWGKFIG